ncbi:amino acid ABC transporter substrate-binding protein [Aneurinibacillus sp. UBA3580]|jgi:cystine transport system substrate-binding protein|uniref:amino acid ABC transporter substrate-binding protein n=1 Tax=Aneurinibacillus sp. UBA3580 TaxID=1946041 RepID=UPI0025796BB0|nr:amino acid ABC transporter substrate-binding protein [Aneurinibacillus sp. UBA3580]
MKKVGILFIFLLMFALTLTACGGNNAGQEQGGKQEQTGSSQERKADNLLAQIKSEGKIKIGTEGTYAPFTFHDKSGKLTGFDVEIAEEIARRLGVKPEFIETKWDGMFAGLDAKRFDIVVNEVGIRDDRKKKYDFSDPYIVSKAVLIVHESNHDIKSFADLKGKKAGQSLTSNLTDIARANGAEIVPTDGFNQAIDLLAAKRIDATVNDGLSFLDLKKQKPKVPVKKVAEQPKGSQSGVLFRKNNPELVEAVNKALADMKKDGTYLKISKKWFGADVSK